MLPSLGSRRTGEVWSSRPQSAKHFAALEAQGPVPDPEQHIGQLFSENYSAAMSHRTEFAQLALQAKQCRACLYGRRLTVVACALVDPLPHRFSIHPDED